MGVGVFLLMFVTGAALVALWLNVRLSRFTPTDIRRASIHLGASMIACQLVSPALSSLLVETGSHVLRMVSLLCVALPALIYAILSVIWIILQVQGSLRNGMMR